MFKKKSLGQHFLHAPAYLRAVVDAADVAAGEIVLEIGPGDGALTRELLGRGARVVAIEKDHRLLPLLTLTFEKEIRGGQLTLIEGDALELDPGAMLPPIYKVVANIPYYITGALLRKFLTSSTQPSTLVFLIQKEVAQRIARSKKESLLSLSVKAYGSPVYIRTVPRGAFVPPPEVDSAILAVHHISRDNFSDAKQESLFFDLLHAGFAQKRKLLTRNLEPVLREQAGDIVAATGLPDKVRAEDVPLHDWLVLTKTASHKIEYTEAHESARYSSE